MFIATPRQRPFIGEIEGIASENIILFDHRRRLQ
jgi:hypothetical protein